MTRTPSASLTELTTAEGIQMTVLSAKSFTIGPEENSRMTRTVERVRYICKRPRGRRTYVVFGYENGTFSSAV